MIMWMVLYVGVDDTDAPDGMCTTYAALEALRRLRESGLECIGYPRLVRLNPNIPWKTRGNGAVSLRVGHGKGSRTKIGEYGGEEIFSYSRGDGVRMDGAIVSAMKDLLLSISRLDCPETNPGIYVGESRPPPSLYWRAVRGFLDPDAVEALSSKTGVVWGPKGNRGIVGASAAVAWRPIDRTYELLAYRWPGRWGSPRNLDAQSVEVMDREFPSTFNNLERASRRVAIAPHSPCPILLGIRGDDPSVLPDAFSRVAPGEPPMAWLVFESNQGTDDHIARVPPTRAVPGQSIRATVRVSSEPKVLPGGHVIVKAQPGNLDCMAYEPSKTFRNIVRGLLPGDQITVWGSVRAQPRGLNLERIRVDSLVAPMAKFANPKCVKCEKAMKSMGRGQPFRCILCGARAPRESATYLPIMRSISPGIYEPPVTSRRHLAKPVKRMSLAS